MNRRDFMRFLAKPAQPQSAKPQAGETGRTAGGRADE